MTQVFPMTGGWLQIAEAGPCIVQALGSGGVQVYIGDAPDASSEGLHLNALAENSVSGDWPSPVFAKGRDGARVVVVSL